MTTRIVAAACVMVAAGPAVAQTPFRFFEPVFPPRGVQVMAHRGIQPVAPENTAAAVLACAVDFIEWADVDVRLTKDGRHVILHDDTLDRTTDGTGPVADITLADFVKLDAGSWSAPRFKAISPLTLEQLLQAAKGKLNLRLNCHRIDPDLLATEILANEMESQVIVYDVPARLAKIRAAGKNAIATMARFQPKTMKFETFIKDVNPAAVEIEAAEVTAEWCRRFHAVGIKVQANVLGTKWDNSHTWEAMIEAGVDWLQTDEPAAVRFSEVRRRIKRFPVEIAYHRGSNRYTPENTLPAIRMAAALGASYVEIDIRTTRDGRFILMHDGTVNRTTGCSGDVAQMTAQMLTRLDAGKWFGKAFAGTPVPTLEEGLAALGENAGVYLDAKDITPESLVAVIRERNLLGRSVVYQSLDYLAKLRAIEPGVRTMPPLKSAADFDTVALEKPYGVDARWAALSRELIARCHQAGIKVFSDALGWNETVDQYDTAIAWGIDVIQTDHPLRVLRAIELHAAERK